MILRPALVDLINNSGWRDGVDEALTDTIADTASRSRQLGETS